MFFGIGGIAGSLASAIGTEYYTPFVVYLFGAFIPFLISIAASQLDDEIETNEYALLLNK